MTLAWYASRLFLQVESIMRNGLRYWWNVAKLAAADAAHLIGWKEPAQKIAATLIAIVALLVACLVTPNEPLPKAALITIGAGLAAALAVFIVAFIVKLATIPPRLATAQATAFSADLAPLKARLEELATGGAPANNARQAALAAENERLNAQLAIAQNETNNARLEHIRNALLRQADEGPQDERACTLENARRWYDLTHQMLQDLAPGAAHKFRFLGWTLGELDGMRMIVRQIAAGLRANEIRP